MDDVDAHLAAQYEAYPYPRRDPRDEARRLIIGSPGHLREIDHWVFAARRPRHQPLNALIAGGGTGDATIMLATQMARANRPGRVTWLDRSKAALTIARNRAEARNLTNIDFVEASLLDLPTSNLGPFDYIDSCGVLHHLPDPAAGLNALTSVLAPNGGLGLMVYAPHGRTGVYMLQDALRILAPIEDPPAARIEVAKKIMRHLPESAWLRRNTYFSDHIEGGDPGLYDLLLNPRDRAYDIPSLFALVENAGLHITCLLEPMRYNPATWLPDPKLRAHLATLAPMQQAAIAEAVTGMMSTHVFYCVRADAIPTPPDPTDPTAIPIAREMPGQQLAASILPDRTIPFMFEGVRKPVPLPAMAGPLLKLIDGSKTIADIEAAMALDHPTFSKTWLETFQALQAVNQILIAAPK